jgi:hypothetical protein
MTESNDKERRSDAAPTQAQLQRAEEGARGSGAKRRTKKAEDQTIQMAADQPATEAGLAVDAYLTGDGSWVRAVPASVRRSSGTSTPASPRPHSFR